MRRLRDRSALGTVAGLVAMAAVPSSVAQRSLNRGCVHSVGVFCSAALRLQRTKVCSATSVAPPSKFSEVRCFTTPMRCSARFSQVRASLPGLGAGWLNNPVQSLGLQLDGPAGGGEPRGVRPCLGAARQARIRDRTRPRSARKDVAVDEDVVLRKPFGQLKHFRKVDAEAGPHAADRGADVGPLCDAAARHGRADAAAPRRLHHRLARREAGAARGRHASTSTITSII